MDSPNVSPVALSPVGEDTKWWSNGEDASFSDARTKSLELRIKELEAKVAQDEVWTKELKSQLRDAEERIQETEAKSAEVEEEAVRLHARVAEQESKYLAAQSKQQAERTKHQAELQALKEVTDHLTRLKETLAHTEEKLARSLKDKLQDAEQKMQSELQTQFADQVQAFLHGEVILQVLCVIQHSHDLLTAGQAELTREAAVHLIHKGLASRMRQIEAVTLYTQALSLNKMSARLNAILEYARKDAVVMELIHMHFDHSREGFRKYEELRATSRKKTRPTSTN